MGKVIEDAVKGDFHPMVGLRQIGNYVKGKVTAKDKTANGNPVVTLELIDLDGSVSKSVSKGVYEEVEVSVGDLVQLIGSVVQLREKLPKLEIGQIATVTYLEDRKVTKGKLKVFRVEFE